MTLIIIKFNTIINFRNNCKLITKFLYFEMDVV